MGCGGVNRVKTSRMGILLSLKKTKKGTEETIQDEELFKEAYKDFAKEIKGLKIDEDNQIVTHKLLNKDNPIFREEIQDHADESGSVKPWIANIVPPEKEIIEDKNYPQESLKIEHVFGFRSYDVRQNLFFTDKDNLCYMNGAVGIVQNINDFSQKIFGGLESEDKGECHDDDVVSICLFKGEVSMVATGQRALRPAIIVWSPLDPSVVYSVFYQTKGTKEVTNLEFDNNGEFIVSVGKDPDHTFFVFQLETKSLFWNGPTGENFIFDLHFNPLGNELCIVGVKTVIFLYFHSKRKTDALIRNKKYAELTYTAVTYTKEGICLISTSSGKVLIWEKCEVVKEVSISNSCLQNLTYSPINDNTYISDSANNVFVYTFTRNFNFNIKDKFTTESIVKAIDVNDDGLIALGMRNGTILVKDLKMNSEKVITRSHYDGKVKGLTSLLHNYALTTGEDNQIMLWNLDKKICEEIGFINDSATDTFMPTEESDLITTEFPLNKCSQTVSYNPKLDHVAIGINNGFISIRKGIRKLNDRVIDDVKISNKEIVIVKYSPDMKWLAVSAAGCEFFVLDAKNAYQVVRKFTGHENFVSQCDWDLTSIFLQAVTNDNYYVFYNINADEKIEDPMLMRNIDWASLSCKFGYYVQGIFMGSTDPNFINSVACSFKKNLIVSGDDDNYINIYNYPCVSDNPKWRSY